MEWQKWEPDARDILIDRVRRGKLSPDEAEAEAAKQGFGPLATVPDQLEFDPERMPWWSLPMALAWIAWRNIASVREHCAEYCEKRLLWVPGSWNVPSKGGSEFERIDGHELKSLGQSTACRLSFVEDYLSSTRTLPTTTQMTVSQAEKELFAALAAGRIVAVAKDAAGNVVEIPDREWPYLQRFEEHERDVLKRDALDREATFSEIIFRREDLKGLWEELLIQPYMIEPMMRAGTAGYVPLCSAVHWIMTEAGQKVQHLEDSQLWKASVDRLLPLISTGEVQIIGTAPGGTPETIEGHIFAGILVSEPMQVSFEMITGDSPWISCTSYIDEEHWKNGFNDELYLHSSATASWTHLQVKKANVLREFSALMDKSIPAAKSSDPLPKMRTDIREIARQLWPDGKTPPRVKERDEAIRAKFKNPPSERTIRRALKDWP